MGIEGHLKQTCGLVCDYIREAFFSVSFLLSGNFPLSTEEFCVSLCVKRQETLSPVGILRDLGCVLR